MENRHAIDLIRALTASSALFIPSNTPYREILMEGVYSLSQLISLVNHSFFIPAQRNSRPLMHALNLITTIISNVEVFAEGVSNLFGSTAYKNLMVLIIEASKASCRLVSMLTSQSSGMLLNWGKADNAGAVQTDAADYLAHYKSACDKILRNLHAKSPTLFQLSSNRPASFRFSSNAVMVGALVPVSAHKGASRAEAGNNQKEVVPMSEPPKPAFQGRRSGIQLNASAFDSIPIRVKITGTEPAQLPGNGDNISPASAATTASASSDEHSALYNTAERDHSKRSDSHTAEAKAVYSTISTRTGAYNTIEEQQYSANYGANYTASGRSSPEYKDNSPGSIYAPPADYTGDYNSSTPYNYGVSSNAAMLNTGLSTTNDNTPYLSTDYIISYNGTPFRAKNTPLSADYSNCSSATKLTLEFEPESEEIVSSSVDSSFDCEVIFTAIYSGSPATLQNAAATNSINTQATTRDVVQDVDTFQGENEHFKNNYLEQVTAAKSPDHGSGVQGEHAVGWADAAAAEAERHLHAHSDGSNYAGSADNSSSSGSKASSAGAGAGAGGRSNAAGRFGNAVFELCAEDALKLGEILYILRPLIYALLVHQIDQYREHRQSHSDNNSTPNNSLANANGAGNTAATVSANGNTAITTTTISSITGRIAEYIASAGNSALTRVLDSISVDALLSALALAVSFVVEFLSIQLTQFALVTLRNRARDDTFIANIGTYLIPASNNLSRNPGTQGNSASLNFGMSSRMPQNAVARKRVYDVYASESGKMAQNHAFDQELSRRRMALFLYLIRSPIFDRTTYPLLKTVADGAKNIPLVGALPEYALGLLSYLNKMHFYNSNS